MSSSPIISETAPFVKADAVGEAAHEAFAAGLSVVPPREDGSKAPLGAWKQYQTVRAGLAELRAWYPPAGRRTGLGVVCGAISGNLEAFEFDARGRLYERFKTDARALRYGGLIDRLETGYLERSPSDGFHWLYRCEVIAASAKLAQYESDEINPPTGKPIIRPLIETRGNGGYLVLAPSHGRVHPTGQPYVRLAGSFDSIPTITPEEREFLLDLARSFDELPQEGAKAAAKASGRPPAPDLLPKEWTDPYGWPDTSSPIDDYNERADWTGLLEGHGWEFVGTAGETQYWRRPGKAQGISATLNHGGHGLFHIFTSSCDFQQNKSVSKFGAYAVLEHGGDFKAASTALLMAGYGTHKRWVQVDGRWELRIFPNPCPKGERVAKPGEGPPKAKGDESPQSDDGLADFLSNPPPPRPVRVELLPVPKLDERLIPEPLRAWLVDIAERASCPLDLPAVGALIALATVVGRKVAIRPKRQDDWTVVPNLWGFGVLPPGHLKSHCLEEPKKPLARLELEARARHEQAVQDFAVSEAVAVAQAEAAKGAMKAAAKRSKGGKAVPDEALRALAAESLARPELVSPVLRRYVVNDATVEKLGELLKENPNGLLQFRDELMGFLRILDKDGHENDRAFYLEAWNGTGSYSYDRIGRGTLFIPSNTVSVLGGIQPGRLAAYIRSRGSGEDDDGFISRFQLAVYPDTGQPYEHVDRWPDAPAKELAWGVFQRLDALDPVSFGARIDADDAKKIPYLRFAEDAQKFFDEWRTDLENRVRSSGEQACLIGHLAKYRSLMPSLALLFHLANGTPGPVSLPSAELAIAWCDYLEHHARRIYRLAFDGDPEPARRLAERIKSSLPNPFSVRQVVKKGWGTLGTTEEVERAVATLEDHGWVYSHESPPGPQGGRPKVAIHVNPLAQGGE